MKTKNKARYKINCEFIVSDQDIKQYNELPNNLPDSKLSEKQIEFVFCLYHKYIAGKITMGGGTDLYEVEKREKWPSGPRMKTHEAMRIALDNLIYLNSRKELTAEQASDLFYSTLTCRETYCKLIQSIYEPTKK